ncbi:MAG: hypothetical protein LBR33_04975 [Propionibacteriaceae bacterium]|nr:hypothetical protein [Propionibacteriaceae bacterium]
MPDPTASASVPDTVATKARGSGTVATERALRATATGPDTVAAWETQSVAPPDSPT